MLSVVDPRVSANRREFLRIGSLGLSGMTLPGLWSAQQAAAASSLNTGVKDKSVIFLFMHGGPTQIETFDPKMSAPEGIRSVTGEIDTALPGITFGGTMTKLAPLADKFSIVRSYAAGDGNHDIKPIVCNDTLKANMGSLYARFAGNNHPETGIPTNAAIFPRAVDPNGQPPVEQFGKFHSTGNLGSGYAPFTPGAGGELQQNMKLSLDRSRLDDRKTLLANLDRIKRQVDQTGLINGMDALQAQAFYTIMGGVADAFDLSKEDPRVVAQYDTSKVFPLENIRTKLNNHKWYTDHVKSLGKLLLLARRLCEAGCGFVTVTTGFVWDMHADVNNAPVGEGMNYCGLAFDHAVAAFIQDLEARGLGNKIMLVATGEMGRTPRVNKGGGRDHWGGLTPLLVYGGGLPMGRVIGQSTRDAGEPLTEKVGIKNLVSTIMHTLLDAGTLRLRPNAPAELLRTLFDASPIPGLMA